MFLHVRRCKWLVESTGEVVGWSVGPTLSIQTPVETLRMSLKRIEGKENISFIYHSDRGCQYANSEYVQILKGHNIRISMTETGDSRDNAQAERINNTMKNELIKGMRFTRIEDIIVDVSKAVDFYNNEGPSMSINMMTPAQAVFCEGVIEKKWFSYQEKASLKNRMLWISLKKTLPLRIGSDRQRKVGLSITSQPTPVISLTRINFFQG